jgi:putative membrane protein
VISCGVLEVSTVARAASKPRQGLIDNSPAVELSASRTSLSFDRTRMSADGNLMSTVRTSLSLIGFGFTIYQVLGKASGVLPRASETGRNLGLAMLSLGLLVLATGIVSYAAYSRELARRRERLYDEGLMHSAPNYSPTATYLSAICLLIIGLGAIASIALRLTS